MSFELANKEQMIMLQKINMKLAVNDANPGISGSITAMLSMLSVITCLSNKKAAKPCNAVVRGAREHNSVYSCSLHQRPSAWP